LILVKQNVNALQYCSLKEAIASYLFNDTSLQQTADTYFINIACLRPAQLFGHLSGKSSGNIRRWSKSSRAKATSGLCPCRTSNL